MASSGSMEPSTTKQHASATQANKVASIAKDIEWLESTEFHSCYVVVRYEQWACGGNILHIETPQHVVEPTEDCYDMLARVEVKCCHKEEPPGFDAGFDEVFGIWENMFIPLHDEDCPFRPLRSAGARIYCHLDEAFDTNKCCKGLVVQAKVTFSESKVADAAEPGSAAEPDS